MKSFKMGVWYCYLDGDSAVFLNRWDQVIERFGDYESCEKWANDNIHLIDVKFD